MAYKVIILYRLYMPSYVLGTFTEYPKILPFEVEQKVEKSKCYFFWVCAKSCIRIYKSQINISER